ncbi:MAG: T9SS type A sorting domain-containing protein [Ignavibacteriae bacterium]|nr:T9SS type A sorting domain-containing protein [Ignavibacteriota bacterium]
MKKIISLFFLIIAFSFSGNVYSQVDSTTLNSSSITSNTTLSRTTTYIMKGFNYIQSGATLTIEPGTKIYGDFETKGTLIIQRGAKIYANASANDPIVFTSEKPAGQRAAGDWGGIIILGRSAINTSTGADSAEIEGFGPGLGPIYGGQPVINDDSSGVLRYVRIEFPGVNLTGVSGNEINGLTMGGVGSRTVIDYVQVSFSGDDSFEWFGGNVNCKHLIAYKGIDDDWDTDNGFRGSVQFGLSVRDTGLVDISTSNGFESDNNNNTPNNYNTPRTKPVFSNMTVIGPYGEIGWNVSSLWGRGGHLRRNTQLSAYNSIIMAWKVGLRFDGSGVGNAAQADTIQIRNTILAGNIRLADSTGTGSFSPQEWLRTPAFGNTIFDVNSSVQLTAPFSIYPEVPLPGTNVNNWMPLGGSPALSGANFNNPNLAGLEQVTFRGAFGTENWSDNWAQFNPKNYTVIGINQLSTVVPDKFSLSQNYPNPFNPSTKIQFDVKNITNGSSNVKLVVYNMTGKEVSTLVNEKLSSGSYEVDFNGSNLSSGVYYYRLSVDGFTETKKMSLIK